MRKRLAVLVLLACACALLGAGETDWQAVPGLTDMFTGPLVIGPEMPLQEADQSYVTSFEWGSVIFESQGLRWPPADLVAAMETGRSLSMWFSPITPAQAMARQRPELQETACRDIDGNKLVLEWYPQVDPPFYQCCTNNPIWQDYLIERNLAAIDIGVDGIIFDEIYGTAHAIWNGGGCFCEYCMSGFRDFLAERYSVQALRTEFGILDISTFDYGAYIHERGYASAWREGRYNQVPLFGEFQAFQHKAVFEAMQYVIGASREYGIDEYGRYIPFAANINDLNASGLKFSDLLDWFVCETFYKDLGYPPSAKILPVAQLAKGLGKLPCFLPAVTTSADLMTWPSTSELFKLLIADAYAGGGTFLVPYEIYAYDAEAQASPGAFRGDLDAIAHYYRFVVDNHFLFTEDAHPAPVALIFSFAPLTEYVWNPAQAPFFDTAAALYDCHITYDVLPVGDGKYISAEFSQDDLTPYSVVIIPDEATLHPEEIEAVQAFCADGGTVLCFSIPAAASLGSCAGHLFYNPNPVSGYFENPRTWQRDQLSSILSLSPIPNRVEVRVNGDAPSQLNEWVVRRDHELAVHLVNYDFDKSSSSVRSVASIAVSIPQHLLGTGTERFYLLSPDENGPTLLEPVIGDESIQVAIESVRTWSIVYAVEEERESELLEELQASLPQIAPGYVLPANATLPDEIGRGLPPLLQRQALLDEAWVSLESIDKPPTLTQTPRVQAMPNLLTSEGAMVIDDFETYRSRIGGQYDNDHDPSDPDFYCRTSIVSEESGNHYRVFDFQWSKWLKFRLSQIPSFDASGYEGFEITIWADSVMKVDWEVAFHDQQQPWTAIWLPDMTLDTIPRRYRLPFAGFDPVPSPELLESLFVIGVWPEATSGRVYWDDLVLYR